MPDTDLWVRGAQADFQAAGHRGANIADLHTMCCQIEEMVQSIALGMSALTEVLRSMKNRIDDIDRWVQTQQALQQGQVAEQEFTPRCAILR